MRVAYVCADPGIPVFGTKGSSIHVQEVVRALLKRQTELHIFATRLDGSPPPDLGAAELHWLSALPKGDPAAREQASIGANRGLYAALAASGTFDLVYERYSLWSYAGMEFARDAGVPSILEVNAPLIQEQARHRGLIDRSSAQEVAERVFSAASNIVVVSKEIARYLDLFASTRGKVHVVPNGVNPARFPAGVLPSHPAGPGEFTVGFVGSFKPWHGLEVLAEAFAELHRRHGATRLLIAGDGPERASLIEMLARSDLLAHTVFAGPIDGQNIAGLLASMDVGVAPYPSSQDFYFSPLKVFEYMAAGLPVVASAVGQLEELIDSGFNGILVAPGDVRILATTLEDLMHAPELRQRLGKQARQSVLASHTWDCIVDRILAIAGLKTPYEVSSGAGSDAARGRMERPLPEAVPDALTIGRTG